MSSTRESMRREFKDLAKLADTMRKDREPDLRSSGEWLAPAPASEESVSSVEEVSAAPPPLARPSNTTVPPIVPAYLPVFGVSTEAAAPASKVRRGVILGLAAGACLVFGLVETGKMGRSLWKAPAAAAAQAATAEPVPAPVAAPTPPPADPVVAAPPPAATGAPPADSPAAATPAPAPIMAAPSTHRRVWHPASDKPSPAAPPLSKKAAAAQPAGPQSLDDLMRKAVATPSK